MKKTWTLDVKQHEDGDYFIEFPDEVLEGAGLRVGDTVEWIDNKDGSWTLKKRETQLVLVECISQFRQRYVVEVPIGVDDFGNDKANWALDTVTMEEAQEFSQEHLGETIVSHRVVTPEEVLKLCDKDNSYCSSWTDEHKMDTFVTKWKEDDVT
jgi:bifunctional DNA-binding transcriptional regulator/antitoxin component of YhaV-PrlF toxin-antitoxin module